MRDVRTHTLAGTLLVVLALSGIVTGAADGDAVSAVLWGVGLVLALAVFRLRAWPPDLAMVAWTLLGWGAATLLFDLVRGGADETTPLSVAALAAGLLLAARQRGRREPRANGAAS